MSRSDAKDIDAQIDLARTIDEAASSPRLLVVAALLTLALVVDGFDVVMVGFLGAPITQTFRLTALDLGWLLAAGQFGVLWGGIVGGLLADKAGRKPALVVAILLFAIGSLLSAVAPGFYSFGATRIFSGIGLGGAAPVIASYLAELLPRRSVSRLSVLAFTAHLLGGTICALTASVVVPAAGWRAMFWIGGVIPLITILPVFLLMVPESSRFLARVGKGDKAVAASLDRLGIAHDWTPGRRFHMALQAKGQGRLRDTLASPWRRDTIVLWAMSVTVMFASVGVINLGALLLTRLGAGQVDAMTTMSYYAFAGLMGAIASVFVVPRFGTRAALLGLLFLACVAMLFLVAVSTIELAHTGWLTAVPMVLIGFGLNGSLIVFFPLAASFYPTEFRAAGSGAAIGIGRAGSTTSFVVLTAVLDGAGPQAVLVVALAVTIGAIGTVLAFRGHVRSSAGQS